MVRDVLMAFSLANLCYLQVWFDLFDSVGYVRAYAPGPRQYLAAILNVTILGLIILGFRRWSAESRHLAVRVLEWFGLACALSVPLNFSRRQTVELGFRHLHQDFGFALILALCLLGGLALWRWACTLRTVSGWTLLVLAPLVAINFGVAVWRMAANEPPGFATKAPLATLPVPDGPSPRLVWMVFDELDYARVFANRPGSVHLPEFDRLRAQSVFATQAFPPSRQTGYSLPALICGRLVRQAKQVAPNELMLDYEGSQQSVPWSQEPNIFSRLHALGLNSALVGWWHPYCRVIGNSLSSCSATTGRDPQDGFLQVLTRQAWRAVGTLPAADHFLAYPVQKQRQAIYLEALHEARKKVRDRTYSLVFIHWDVPHPPGIYDRQAGRFAATGNYLDNLELADRTIGDIRRELEEQGTWDSTTLVITSDHWWRSDFRNQMPAWTGEEARFYGSENDRRVPFLLKLAGQKEGRVLDESFNTVLIHDLTLEILNSRILDPDGAAAWIRSHPTAGRGESLVQLGQ